MVEGGGGSELDGFYAKIENGRLYMFMAGNLQTNFNKLDVYFDTRAGGQNTIDGSTLPTGVDEFSSMGTGPFDGGALQRQSGLTFDAGFGADYYLSMSHGYENALDDPNAPGNRILFWAASAHFSDMTIGSARNKTWRRGCSWHQAVCPTSCDRLPFQTSLICLSFRMESLPRL